MSEYQESLAILHARFQDTLEQEEQAPAVVQSSGSYAVVSEWPPAGWTPPGSRDSLTTLRVRRGWNRYG